MIELLARLNTGAQVLDMSIHATGERLLVTDIAAALHGVTDGQYMLLMAKYAGYHGLEDKLINAYLFKVLDLKKEMGWKQPKKDFYRTVTKIALMEAISPPKCSRCKGRGEHPDLDTKLITECGKCGGSGNVKIIDAQKANMLEISRPAYLKTWCDRWPLIRGIFEQDEREALIIFKRNLRCRDTYFNNQ